MHRATSAFGKFPRIVFEILISIKTVLIFNQLISSVDFITELLDLVNMPHLFDVLLVFAKHPGTVQCIIHRDIGYCTAHLFG